MENKKILDTYDRIVNELKSWEGSRIARECCEYLKNKNPYHIDLALILCKREGLEISKTMQPLVMEVAEKRFNGETKGTARRIKKDSVKSQIMLVMANCIYEKYSQEESAEIALIYIELCTGDKSYGSVDNLIREYRKAWLDTGEEGEHFKRWDKYLKTDETFKKGREEYRQQIKAVYKLIHS